ncbi:MAG TPA: aminotransferase class V-fold PLP-dependent enzyme, partial [Polyangiales bacterium]
MPSDFVPRLGDRSAFSQLRAVAYLNHAGISPASDPVRAAAMRALVEQSEQGSVAFGARMVEREALREKLATLLHADVDELALVPNTMYGLSAIAVSLPWRGGGRAIVFDGEYPTNVSVWQSACDRFGVTITHLPLADLARPDGPDFSRLEAELAKG